MRRDLVTNVELAVSEAATNAVRHSGASTFEIECRVEGRSLVVTVSDRGGGSETANPGAGLGLHIIHGVAEAVHIERTGPGTCVTMRFDRRASHGAA